jgi:hypothetical protein
MSLKRANPLKEMSEPSLVGSLLSTAWTSQTGRSGAIQEPSRPERTSALARLPRLIENHHLGDEGNEIANLCQPGCFGDLLKIFCDVRRVVWFVIILRE